MQFLWFSWSCNLKSMKIWTPPMLRHLKFIVWSIIWALDQSFWLLELQVMTLQSGVPSQFWHFFNNLEKILSFFPFLLLQAILIFLTFDDQNENPTSFSWSLAQNVQGWPKISKSQTLSDSWLFLPDDPESSVFRGILWLWCDSHLIGTP